MKAQLFTLFSGVALAIATSASYAQGTVTINQTGSANQAQVQQGDLNDARITQNGNNNRAAIHQH